MFFGRSGLRLRRGARREKSRREMSWKDGWSGSYSYDYGERERERERKRMWELKAASYS